MKTSQLKNKISILTEAIISLGIILAVTPFIFFLLGKDTPTPVKGDSMKHTNTQQQEMGHRKSTSKQKRPDGKPVGKVVYLTFDDGPSKLTGQILDILKEQHIKATFFMQGSHLKNTTFKENVKRAIKEGHYIGAHSITHDSDNLYKNGKFVSEMQETLSLIYSITGTTPKLVRPPYGSVPGLNNTEIRNQIVEAGIKVWDWTIDSNDWKFKDNPNQIIENIKKHTTEDIEVVLMHEKPQTLQALTQIIAFYKEKGYEFGVYNDADHFHLNFQKDKRL